MTEDKKKEFTQSLDGLDMVIGTRQVLESKCTTPKCGNTVVTPPATSPNLTILCGANGEPTYYIDVPSEADFDQVAFPFYAEIEDGQGNRAAVPAGAIDVPVGTNLKIHVREMHP